MGLRGICHLVYMAGWSIDPSPHGDDVGFPVAGYPVVLLRIVVEEVVTSQGALRVGFSRTLALLGHEPRVDSIVVPEIRIRKFPNRQTLSSRDASTAAVPPVRVSDFLFSCRRHAGIDRHATVTLRRVTPMNDDVCRASKCHGKNDDLASEIF